MERWKLTATGWSHKFLSVECSTSQLMLQGYIEKKNIHTISGAMIDNEIIILKE